MTLQTLSLVLLLGYLIWVLYSKIAADSKKIDLTQKVRVISQKTGQVLDIQFSVDKNASQQRDAMTDESFLTMSKILFQKTVDSFAHAEKKDLKQLLTDPVYTLFEKEIDNRVNQKAELDFSLIGILSAKILDKSNDYETVTVEFITEQVNVLKNAEGNVIEGDALHVAQMRDVWTFQKEGKFNWLIASTKSEPYHA